MSDFLSNPWVKRTVSVFNLAYFAVISMLTFATFLYSIEFTQGKEVTFFVIYFIASILFMGLMIYSRREFCTKLVSVLLLPVTFALIMFNWGNWILIVPPFVVALVIFFASGVHETTKVVLGTIYMLLYVLGLVGFLVLRMLFGGSSVTTVLDQNLPDNEEVFNIYNDETQWNRLVDMTRDENLISPDGKYKLVLYDIQDNDKGRIKICVVPYGEDIELKFFTLKQKGIEKTISNKGTRGTIPEFGWEPDGKGGYRVYYVLSQGAQRKYATVNENNMPKKQYFEFLGIK